MTSPISPVTSPESGEYADASSLGTAGLLDPTTFLSLLVDELKYQNPLDPTSSSDFMSQIAQLSQVEQLQSVSSASQMGEAAGLIGKTVTANDESGNAITGVVTGVTNGTIGPAAQRGQHHRVPRRRGTDRRPATPRAERPRRDQSHDHPDQPSIDRPPNKRSNP